MKLLPALLVLITAPVAAWQPVTDITSIADPKNATPGGPRQQGEPMPELPGVSVHRPGQPSSAPAPVQRFPIKEDIPAKIGDELANLCFGFIRKSFYDPYSAKLDEYQTYRMPDGQIGMVVMLNAKNRFSAYVGSKPYHCIREHGKIKIGEGGL